MPPTTPLRHATLLALGLAFAGLAQAQATITHDKALAGSITPGDTAGYPVTISQPGSYKLMSNLYAPLGVSGIVIAAANVTLDLNGFTIQGGKSCSRNSTTGEVLCNGDAGESRGVQIASAASSAVLRNGTISGFSSGISTYGSLVAQDLRLTQNKFGAGAQAAGAQTRWERVEAAVNEGFGLALVSGSHVLNGVDVHSNGNAGIAISNTVQSVALYDSTIKFNASYGITRSTVSGPVMLRGVLLRGNPSGNVSGGVVSVGGNLNENTVF